MSIAGDDARVIEIALGWAAFDYSNQRAIVGPGYLAHAVRWRSANRRLDSETLGTDVMTDIITMRARGFYSGTNALQNHGAGWTFSMAYEDVAGTVMFGHMEYPDYPLPARS